MPLTPSQVADTLETAPSTIRRWSVRFERFMSFDHSTGQKRLYSLEDLAFLRKVRDLSKQGLPLSKIEETLRAEVIRAEPGETALMTISDVAEALAMAREAYASIERKNEELQERVKLWRSTFKHPGGGEKKHEFSNHHYEGLKSTSGFWFNYPNHNSQFYD